MPISVPGHTDHRFRDDGDHDSGMMPIAKSLISLVYDLLARH
jgi:hypothetical protein